MNCIENSKSLSPDVRLLRVAEHLAKEGFERIPGILREIAGEVRALMPSPRLSGTAEACLALIDTSDTEADLFSTWRDVVPTMASMEAIDRLRILETWVTRVCVVSLDDGR